MRISLAIVFVLPFICRCCSDIYCRFECRYTGSDSRIGNRQGGSQTSNQAQPAPKQPNLNELGDAGGFEIGAKPTQPEPIIESRAVYQYGHYIPYTEVNCE